MKYRRVFVPGGTYFFTLVTFERRMIFVEEQDFELLRQSFRVVQRKHPFSIDAAVVLPDHLHLILTLPETDSDFPTRLRLIKSHFTHNYHGLIYLPESESRLKKGEQAVWQRRYWEHLIRDDMDYQRHVDYIHYNPVKHGLVDSPTDWMHSSIHAFVKQGLYQEEWGTEGIPEIDLVTGLE